MFEDFIERVLQHEGRYSRHPDDPGGETMWGVTQRTAREAGYRGNMRYLLRDEAKEIYRKAYWNRIQGDRLNPVVAFQVFDGAVNSGVSRSVRWMQEILGIDDDGIVGPITLEAASKFDPLELAVLYNSTRLHFLAGLPHWGSFGGGWARRIAANLKHASQDYAAYQITV
jgi:lysozyme family protein